MRGALLIANHAGAIPADAPAIMHGIETELGRPVYGLTAGGASAGAADDQVGGAGPGGA